MSDAGVGMERQSDDAADEPYLAVRNLTKHYDDEGILGGDPVRAVDGVSFDVRRGETFGVVGESGCGKTTLGHSLLGLETPTDGTVRVDGRDVTDITGERRREWRRDAQIVFQDPDDSLNGRMTVGEIVREPLDAHDWRTPDQRRDRVFEVLERVGLTEDHYYRYPHEFSGGQRQRVGIARALALKPDFLVLDEPMSALDVSVQARIINLLDDLQAELDLTYLFIAHDLAVVRHICDRVAVMYLGETVEVAPTEELFADPNHPYTRSLLSAIPGSHGTDGDRITLRGTPPSPRRPPDGCRFHTRCPARIRPEEFDHLPDPVWTAIDEFREVLRQRRHDAGLADRVKRRLDVRATDVEAAADEAFDGVDVPQDVATVVDRTIELADSGRYREATEALADAFGSVCETDRPRDAVDGEERTSRCHRHDPDYEDVDAVLDR